MWNAASTSTRPRILIADVLIKSCPPTLRQQVRVKVASIATLIVANSLGFETNYEREIDLTVVQAWEDCLGLPTITIQVYQLVSSM